MEVSWPQSVHPVRGPQVTQKFMVLNKVATMYALVATFYLGYQLLQRAGNIHFDKHPFAYVTDKSKRCSPNYCLTTTKTRETTHDCEIKTPLKILM